MSLTLRDDEWIGRAEHIMQCLLHALSLQQEADINQAQLLVLDFPSILVPRGTPGNLTGRKELPPKFQPSLLLLLLPFACQESQRSLKRGGGEGGKRSTTQLSGAGYEQHLPLGSPASVWSCK